MVTKLWAPWKERKVPMILSLTLGILTSRSESLLVKGTCGSERKRRTSSSLSSRFFTELGEALLVDSFGMLPGFLEGLEQKLAHLQGPVLAAG